MPSSDTTTATRRGRPRAGERAERRQRILDAALAELVERGFDQVTMLGVASRAGASKETLYNWFDSREGLFAALVIANADASVRAVERALDHDAPPEIVLTGFANGLLTLLTTEASIALNRAAMSSPDLAGVLLEHGRHRVGPIVEAYLARRADAGVLSIADPAEAFELLYGLIVRDTQIRVLLGESRPQAAVIRARVETAVAQFLDLTGSPQV